MSNVRHLERAISSMRNGDVEIHLIDITPQMASDWIAANVNNRQKSAAVVAAYKADLMTASWPFTGDAIRFHKDGTLIDGQHRCTAISEMPDDFSVRGLVVSGLGDAAQVAMDQGRKRTAADQLTISGKASHAPLVAAVAKHMLVVEAGRLFTDRVKVQEVTTTQRILQWVEDHPDDVELIHAIAFHVRKTNLAPSIVAAAAVIAAKTYDGEEVRDYIQRLATGEDLSAKSPILALRERAQNNRFQKKKDRERDTLGLVLKAIDFEAQGKQLGKMQLPHGGTYTSKTFPIRLIKNYLGAIEN